MNGMFSTRTDAALSAWLKDACATPLRADAPGSTLQWKGAVPLRHTNDALIGEICEIAHASWAHQCDSLSSLRSTQPMSSYSVSFAGPTGVSMASDATS